MKRFIWGLIAFVAVSCSTNPYTPSNVESDKPETNPQKSGLYAVKDSWKHITRSTVNAVVHDIPWQEGEKVMFIRLDGDREYDRYGNANMNKITFLCTAADVLGLECALVPDAPLEDGVYQAVYPVYDYIGCTSYNPNLYIHLSFLYEEGLGLDYKHQDIVVSDPITYTKDQAVPVVMKHICALVDIDIYPPKTGDYILLKVVADKTVFPGKVNYDVTGEYDCQNTWFNFATLRAGGNSMTQGELFQTSTGLVPIEYNEMPMKIYLVYKDGTYYLSEEFKMPSLRFGEENKIIIDEFVEIKDPVQGLWADNYMDDKTYPYDILEWEL